MKYSGLRITTAGIFVRFRHEGQIVEQGPYATPAEALAFASKRFHAPLHTIALRDTVNKVRDNSEGVKDHEDSTTR